MVVENLWTIIHRELSLLSRSNSHFLTRTVFAGIPICLISFFLLDKSDIGNENGRHFLSIVTQIGTVAAWFSGGLNTINSLNRERREGTLHLLLMTSLTPFQIIIGKWLSRSLTNLLNIFGLIPLLSIPLLLGGIGPTDVILSLLSITITMAVSSTIGLLISAIIRDQTKGIIAILAILIFSPFISPFIIKIFPIKIPEMNYSLFLPTSIELLNLQGSSLRILITGIENYILWEFRLSGTYVKLLIVSQLVFWSIVSMAILQRAKSLIIL